jgi:cobalamin biosynthesis protein CbiG
MSTPRVVIGIGLSSRATAEDVALAVDEALRSVRLAAPPSAVATRAVLANDARLRLGLPVIGIEDAELVHRSRPVERAVGVPARVAETAALLAAGDGSRLLGPTHRLAHVTVAVASAAPSGTASAKGPDQAPPTATISPTGRLRL